jgi:signal transduction histidine kinase
MVQSRPSRQVIREVVDGIVEELSYDAEERKVTVDTSDVTDVAASADTRLLRRVLQEVIANAIYYSREGGGVKVCARPDPEGVLIGVTDTGIGIAEKEEDMVFTKFFRGSNFDTTAIVGAGLGLNIAKGYIKLMHGYIWFTCKQNEGCTFSMQLPADRGNA